MKNFTEIEGQWFEDNFDKSDVISFDVFDTLVERSFLFEPSELFESVYGKVFSNQQFGRGFKMLRIEAERIAREKAEYSGFQEITLIEIYEQLAKLSEFDEKTLKVFKKEEALLEIDACYAKPKGKDLFEFAKKKGKNIWIISDIYLDRNTIEQILSKNGFEGYEKLVISSEPKLTKHTGDLFKSIKIGNEDKKIFHIGDNIFSDYHHPRAHEIEAAHIPSRRDLFHQSKSLDTVLFDEQSKLLNPLFFLHGSSYHINGLKDKNKFEKYFFSIGYSLMCPLVIGFVNALNKKKEFKSHDQLICLARDGQIVHRVADRLFNMGISRFESKYIYASRRVTSLPFVKQDPHIIGLYFLDTFKNSKSVNEFIEKLYISDTGLKVKAKTIFSKIKKERHYFKAMAEFYKLWQPYLKKEQDDYIEYVTKEVSPNPSVVFDAGWSGSLLKGMNMVMPDMEMAGYFFGVEPYSPMVNPDLYGYYLEYDKPMSRQKIVEMNKALIECLFMADHASVVGVDKIDGKFVPKFAEEGDVGIENAKISKLIAEGVEACLNDIENNLPKNEYPDYIRNIEAKELLDYFITAPSKDDFKLFGNVQLLSGIGDTKGVPLIDKKGRKGKKVKIKNSHWKSGALQIIKRYHK